MYRMHGFKNEAGKLIVTLPDNFSQDKAADANSKCFKDYSKVFVMVFY
jgi:hypothetical protein